MPKLEFDISVKEGGLKELNRQIREMTQTTSRLIAEFGKESDVAQKAGNQLKSLKEQKRELLKATTDLSGGLKKSSSQLLEMGENITVVLAGIKSVAGGMFNFGKTAITSAADFEELRSHFKGAESDIYNFQKATAFTVSKSDLIKLSNQANDLGIEMSKQPMFFLLAKDAAEKYGTDVSTAFQSVIMATEGNIRGLKQIGVQKEVYKQIVSELTQSMGGEIETTTALNGEQEINIKNLDPLVQKNIRVEAILKATGITMDDVNKKTQSNADKLAQLDLLVPQVKKQFGELLAGGIIPLTDALKDSEGKFNSVALSVTGAGLAFGEILPTMAALKLAIPEVSYTIVKFFGPGSVALLALLAIAGLIASIKDEIEDTKEAYKNLERMKQGDKVEYKSGTGDVLNKQHGFDEILTFEEQQKLGINSDMGGYYDYKTEIGPQPDKTKPGKTKTTGTGRGTGPSEIKKEIDEIIRLEQELQALQAERVNLVESYGLGSGIVLETDKKILEIEKQIDYLRTGAHAPKKLDMVFPEFELLPYAQTGNAFDQIVAQSKPMTDALVQQSEIYRESWGNTISSITGGLGTLFAELSNGGDSGEAFKGFMKGIVGTFITSIQAMLIASNASLLAKGITTFGISLITDAPMLAAGWLALEAAKGFIGGLERGGQFSQAGTYLVGEAGPELVKFDRPGVVHNNSETRAMLRPVQNNNTVKNIVTVRANNALLRELIEVTIDKIDSRNTQLAY